MGRVAWDNKTAWIAIMEQFFTEDMIYDTNYNPNQDELNNSTGIEVWFYQEHIPFNLAFDNVTFNQLIFYQARKKQLPPLPMEKAGGKEISEQFRGLKNLELK